MGMTHEDNCAPMSLGMTFLKQDVGHMRKIREYETREARYRAALERAAQVMIDGDVIEREIISRQIIGLLNHQEDMP